MYSEEYGWFPDLHVLRSLLPAVAKNDGGTFCHADGTPVVIKELPTWGAAERIIRHMSDRPLEEFNETYHHAPMWFQRYVEIARAADGTPVEWRVFFLGTKVVFANAYWGQGAERCTVLGVPKYTDELVGVVIRSDLLEDFRCERMADGAVIRALVTNRLGEPFERKRETNIRGYYELWGQSEDVRRHIEERAEDFNAWLDGVRCQRKSL